MERRDTLGALAAALIGGAMAGTEAAAQSADPRTFTVHSGCSGWIINQNGPDDYSVRMVGEDRNSSLKFIRLTGPDAFAEAQDIWRTLMFLSQKFGIPFITRPGA